MTRRNLLPYLLAAIVAVVAGVGWWRSEQGRQEALGRITQLEAANAALRGQQPPSSSMAPAVPAGGGNPGKENPSATAGYARVPKAQGGAVADTAADAKIIDDLQQRVQDLSKDLAAVREEIAKAESKAAADAAEAKKLQTQLDELRDSAHAGKRSLDAVEAELKAKSERLARSEAAEKAAADRALKAEATVAKASTQSKELEDLIRRRETLLTTVLRRYRDVTDLYRNFTLNAQTRETPGVGLQAGDLSRIQSAIQQAEEDLRQLNSLNARVAQASRAK